MGRVAIKTFVIAVLAAVFFSSCSKIEQDERTGNSLVVKLDVPEKNTVYVYRDEPYEFHFTVDRASCPAIARVTLAEGLEAKVLINNSGEGILTITTQDGGHAQVNVFNGTGGCILDVYAQIHDIEIDAEDGFEFEPDGRTIVRNIRTTIPEEDRERIEAVSDAPWLDVTTDGKTVTLKAPWNNEYKVRVANVTLRAKNGNTEGKTMVFTQGWEDDTPEGCIAFRDRPFKDACLKVADTDADGHISFSEALGIRRLDIRGLGIENLTGIDYFRDLEEIDFRDNRIEHADMLTNLPKLHFLDMEGNPLKTFDVHGCQQVFSLCRFDTRGDFKNGTFEPQYKVKYGQVNVSAACDSSRRGSKTVDFTKPSSVSEEMDYEVHLLKRHNRGPGYPLILMGIGFTDTEVEDGNYRRLIDVMFNALTKGTRDFSESKYNEYFDYFFVDFISPKRECSIEKDWWETLPKHVMEFEKRLATFYEQEYFKGLWNKVLYYAYAIDYYKEDAPSIITINCPEFNDRSSILHIGRTRHEDNQSGLGNRECLIDIECIDLLWAHW